MWRQIRQNRYDYGQDQLRRCSVKIIKEPTVHNKCATDYKFKEKFISRHYRDIYRGVLARMMRFNYNLQSEPRRPGTPQEHSIRCVPSLSVTDTIISSILLLSILLAYIRGNIAGIGDTQWFIPTAISILREGNTDLQEYRDIAEEHYATVKINERIYNLFPDAVSFLITPVVWIADVGYYQPQGRDLCTEIGQYSFYKLERFIASIFVSLAVMLYYLIARHYMGHFRSIFASLVFAFCTSAWSSASRGLWQHGPSMFLLTMSLYFLIVSENNVKILIFSAFPLYLSFWIRPTNSISVIVFSTYVILRHRRDSLTFFMVGILIFFLFFMYYYSIFGDVLPYYFMPSRLRLRNHFFYVISSNLFSPSRGLLLWNSIFLFSFFGFYSSFKRPKILFFEILALIISFAHLISISSFPHWWGGWSIGPRFFTDVIPYLMFMLIPVFSIIFRSFAFKNIYISFLFIISVLFSFIPHARSSLDEAVMEWSALPVDIDRYPARIWDWGDIQFLRGIQVMTRQPTRLPLPAYTRYFLPNRTRTCFGQAMSLRGYELFVTESHARKPRLVLYWIAGDEIDFDYSVFVHLMDDEGNMVAQSDHAPGYALHYPPSLWRSGDLIWDAHELDLGDSVPAGTYNLRIGVYNWATGQRLAASGKGDIRNDALLIPELILVPDHVETMTFHFPLVHQLYTVISPPLVAP
jgi:hypothetical protein